jgi:DNA-directed RNA polymerase alpha subunit
MTDPPLGEYVPCPRHGTHCFREIPDLAQRIECAIGLGDGGIAGVKATAERVMMMVEDHVLAELADVDDELNEARLHNDATCSAVAERDTLRAQRDEIAGRLPIEELELDRRAYNILTGSGICHIGELLRMTEDELYQMRNMGKISMRNIKDRLRDAFGLALRQEGAP